MRSVALISVLVVSGVLGACGGKPMASSGSGDAAMSAAPIEHATATLKVAGLGCPLCAHNIDKSLMEVPGVTGAKVDLSTGRVNVTLSANAAERPSAQRLAKVVEDSGFTLEKITTP